MAATTNRFVYTPLDATKKQIRVVQVQLYNKKTGVVSCKLKTIDLIDNAYSALSYTWGEPEPTHAILLNGCHFEVRQNLYDFLVRACRPKISEWLFIDAIGINQEDVEERGKLVRMMGEVYKLAERVLIFPGRVHRGTDLCNLLLRYTLATRRALMRHRLMHNYSLYSLFLLVSSKSAECLVQVFCATYWQRLWVVQELVVAKAVTIVLRKTKMEWSTWSFVNENLKDTHPPRYNDFEELLNAVNVTALREDYSYSISRRHPLDIGGIVIATWECRCTEANDRIFALIGMLPTTFESLPVDYKRPWESVAVDFIERVLKESTLSTRDVIFSYIRYLNVLPELLCQSCYERQARAVAGSDATSCSTRWSGKDVGDSDTSMQRHSFWLFCPPFKTEDACHASHSRRQDPEHTEQALAPSSIALQASSEGKRREKFGKLYGLRSIPCFRCDEVLIQDALRACQVTKRVLDDVLMLEEDLSSESKTPEQHFGGVTFPGIR